MRENPRVRCRLELRTPSNGTGWSETWTFNGTDDRLLRDCLQQLAEFAAEPPTEVWNRHAMRHEVRDGDRWHAAMLLWPDEPWERGKVSFEDRRADEAWTATGAAHLADILPDRLDDLRAAIRARFSATRMQADRS
jgi:hypothetical protein